MVGLPIHEGLGAVRWVVVIPFHHCDDDDDGDGDDDEDDDDDDDDDDKDCFTKWKLGCRSLSFPIEPAKWKC